MKTTSTGSGKSLAALMALAIAMPILVVIFTGAGASTSPARACGTNAVGAPSELGDLGVIDGPIGGPVTGKIGVASANIPNRSGMDGFRASMPKVLSTNPDFVTLNEMSARSLAQIEAAAPGYSAYRTPAETGPDAIESMGTVLLWKSSTWILKTGGRVKVADDDKTYYKGRPVTWDRHAAWAMLQRKSDGAVVSIIATHHMTNPHKFPRQHGNPPLTRPQQYGQGMDILIQLANSLATHGPVLGAGDMNTHSSYTNLPWSAVSKMSAAGYGWYNHSVDFVFFPKYQGVKLDRGWTGSMVSDHQWVSVRLDMNGAGPTAATTPASTTASTTTAGDAAPAAAPASDVHAQLMRLRFADGYPTITAEQAKNAIVIAQVARDLNVPRRGLEIAIATTIQESNLVNLPGGDADSGGLFQQRPAQGWGTREQVTTPRLATEAFFGRADHTDNTGLLDIAGWEQMPLTEAAATVQNPRADLRGEYAQWDTIAGVITDLLGGDLPDIGTQAGGGDCQSTANVSCPTDESRYNLGNVKPQLTGMVNILGPMFNIETVGGYRASATDPDGHPAGLAADFMTTSKAQGDALAAYAREHAAELGIDYIIWWQRVWSVTRSSEGWRPMEDRGGKTENHRDHVHINVLPDALGSGDGAGPATCGTVGTGTGPFTPSQIPYVGPFDATTLNTRMQTIINADGLPNVDPFFGTQSDASWYRDCQKFVAILDGRSASGYSSAGAAWAHFQATGKAHPVGSADAMSPPVGAWLYYGPNHVVVYLGNNLVAGTDTWGTGTAKIGPASDISNGIWHQPYRGWVAPWG